MENCGHFFLSIRKTYRVSAIPKKPSVSLLPSAEADGLKDLEAKPLPLWTLASLSGKSSYMYDRCHLLRELHLPSYRPETIVEKREVALQAPLQGLSENWYQHPRNKFGDVNHAYLTHSKKRKRKAFRSKMLKRQLINLQEKLLHQTDDLHSFYKEQLEYTADYHCRLAIIRKTLKR